MIYYIGNNSEFPTAILADIINFCRERKVVGFDYETTGLDYYLDKPVLVSIGDYNTQYVVDIREIGMYWLKEILESNSITKVCHNCQFEYNMSKQYGIICANLWDTMLGEMILHTDKLSLKGRFSLEYLVKDYFGIELDKETQTSFIGFTGEFNKRQIEYSANDVKYMPDLRDRLMKQILEQNMQVKIEMENENALVAADQSYNGLYVNKEKWLKLYESNLAKVNNLVKELDDTLIIEYTSVVNNLSLLGDDGQIQSGRLLSLNWNSPQQTKPVFKAIGINAIRRDKKTKENKETMDIKSLKKIKNKPEILKKFIEYREFFKEVSTYGEKFLKYIHPVTGRIHPSVNTIVSTGRESQRKPRMLGL